MLHLTYFVFISVLLLILAIGAVLAYVFREQVNLVFSSEATLQFVCPSAIPNTMGEI